MKKVNSAITFIMVFKDMEKEVLIIAHGSCNDGFCSAWLVKKIYKDASVHHAVFGQEIPDVSGKDVIMLDFSYKRNVIIEMQKKANSFLLLDHHKTAAKELENLPNCIFDLSKSGASLTWDYFFGGKRPWLVNYTEDRDLLKYNLPFSREINAVLESYPFEFSVWDELDEAYTEDEVIKSPLVLEGKSILRYQDKLIDTIIAHAVSAILDEYKIRVANTSCMFSTVANRLAQSQPFGLAWYLREDGKYVHSLSSRRDGVDVSEIAKRHGGGGHHNSAAYQSSEMTLKFI